MKPETIDTSSYYQQSTFRDLLNDCRKNKQFIDVQLQVRDKLFDAHRNVLSISSPVLKAALSDHWSTTKICPISDEYVDPEIVEDLLGFLYTGKIKLTPDNAHSVCVAAHYLQIQTLVDSSARYLSRLLTVENVLTLFQFALNCRLATLGERCVHFIQIYNKEVFQDSSIPGFSFDCLDNFIRCLEALTANDRQYDLCDIVLRRQNSFDCIVRWTEKNLPKRSNNLPVLLKNIPLDGLPYEFLAQTVSTHPLIKESASCQQILSDAIENCSDRPMEDNQSLILIGSTDPDHQGDTESSMICYKPRRDFPDLNRISAFATAVINKRDIVVSGGFINSDDETDKVEVFDFTTQTWRELPSMPCPLVGHSMTAHNGHLYVVGGVADSEEDVKNNRFARTEVLCYTFETQQWKYVKSLNIGHKHGSLIAYKNHLYAVGQESIIERYDPALDTWTIIPTMGQSATFFAAALHEDKIYVSGDKGFEVYDIRTNVWSQLEQTDLLFCSILVSINGKLLALDCRRVHESGSEDSMSIDEVDPEESFHVEERDPEDSMSVEDGDSECSLCCGDSKDLIFVLWKNTQTWHIYTEQANLEFIPEYALAITSCD